MVQHRDVISSGAKKQITKSWDYEFKNSEIKQIWKRMYRVFEYINKLKW